jgi:crotonobetainyl-CoA:carnitine CoA-transferase CaiB-like acyl-CoA transferase
MWLAEQGADVIKVQPPRGDWVTPIWLSTGWGKKSILLDIKSDYGKQRFIDLLADANVFLCGQRPGVLERLGLEESVCEQINPNLVLTTEHYAPLARHGDRAADLNRLRKL